MKCKAKRFSVTRAALRHECAVRGDLLPPTVPRGTSRLNNVLAYVSRAATRTFPRGNSVRVCRGAKYNSPCSGFLAANYNYEFLRNARRDAPYRGRLRRDARHGSSRANVIEDFGEGRDPRNEIAFFRVTCHKEMRDKIRRRETRRIAHFARDVRQSHGKDFGLAVD